MTDEQIKKAFIDALAALYEIIKISGGIPSGHLYARLMDKMTLDQYNQLIGYLKQHGLVNESNHFLTANEV